VIIVAAHDTKVTKLLQVSFEDKSSLVTMIDRIFTGLDFPESPSANSQESPTIPPNLVTFFKKVNQVKA
jgi:hypothetical protein